MSTLSTAGDVALIGMAGRFPGARDVDSLWSNLAGGVESITRFSEAELASSGLLPEGEARRRYVGARGVLEDVELFDAQLFGVAPREAELTDPQARIFLEVAHEALERAAIDLGRFRGVAGVFAGCSWSTYLKQLEAAGLGSFEVWFKNDKDFLTAWVASKLDLTGPAVGVQCFCSTSLAAVHLACASLNAGECDLALAGGVTVQVPWRAGYSYQEGGLSSRDGRTRPFDARASGTVFGDGAGAVVLRRLEDALADGDPILAIIKGTALNNDGARKASFLAPSASGQAAAIVQALASAGVEARSIAYVEAHGTATLVGDAIEVAALTQAFRRQTAERGFCAIGSVKSNVGHLDRAAGVVALIKTVSALRRGVIPATIGFDAPNPGIDFDESPFRIARETRPWEGPRRACVNSFAIGGTNVHVVLEAPPELAVRAAPEGAAEYTLPLSARSEAGVASLAERLARHWEAHPELGLAQVAHTLQQGRAAYPVRRAVVARDRAEAIALLRAGAPAPPDVRAGRATEHARAFIAGRAVEWVGSWAGARAPRRVELPPGALERSRHWVEARAPAPARGGTPAAAGAATFAPSWRRLAPLPRGGQTEAHAVAVVLGERPGLAEQARRAGLEVLVRGADEGLPALFERAAALTHARAGAGTETSLGRKTPPAARELHILDGRDLLEDPVALLLRGIELARALPPLPVSLSFVTDHLVDVSGGEAIVPSKSAILGVVRVLPLELPHVRARVIDDDQADPASLWAAHASAGEEPVLALRSGRAWAPCLEPVTRAPAASVLRPRGTYLITGGLGRVGLAIARRFARSGLAPRLLLLQRTPPAPTDPRLRELEALGAETHTIVADVTDAGALRAALPPELHGVVHAAGLTRTSSFRALLATGAEHAAAHLAPRVTGLHALLEAIGARALDFLIVPSSSATVRGGLGMAAYVTAHAVAEAEVAALRRRGWSTVQMDRLSDEAGGPGLVSPELAAGAVELTLAHPELSWLCVGTADLAHPPTPRARPLAVRPQLEAAYVPPATPEELRVAELCSAVLGVAPVGTADNFFALGGDSFSATRLLALLAAQAGVEIPPATFFTRPTVAALASELGRAPAGQQPELRRVERRGVARTKEGR